METGEKIHRKRFLDPCFAVVSGAGEGTSHGLCWEQAAPSLPFPWRSVSADRKTWGQEFGEAPKRGAGGAQTGLTLGMSPGAAAGPSLLPHSRDTAGLTSRKTRDVEVTTQVPPSHLPSKAAHKHLGCAEGEQHTRAKLCPPLLCSPRVQLGLRQDGAAAELGWSQCDSVLLWERGTSSKPTL